MVNKVLKIVLVAVGTILVLLNVPTAQLGIAVKYLGLAVASLILVVVTAVFGYYFVLRMLGKVGDLAWGDVLEKHLYGDEDVTADEIPHRARIWVAYATGLLREWLSGNFKWVSFKAYHKDMVENLVDDYDEFVENNQNGFLG